MMGPLLTYDDEAHLELLLNAARAAKIEIHADATRHSWFWFRRGWGLVVGLRCVEDKQTTMYFGFGHPFNPLLWAADGRLLYEIERIFLAHGSQQLRAGEVT